MWSNFDPKNQVPAGNRAEMIGVNFQNGVKKRQMVSINLSAVTPRQAKGIIGKFLSVLRPKIISKSV